jgi:hypothetical protein
VTEVRYDSILSPGRVAELRLQDEESPERPLSKQPECPDAPVRVRRHRFPVDYAPPNHRASEDFDEENEELKGIFGIKTPPPAPATAEFPRVVAAPPVRAPVVPLSVVCTFFSMAQVFLDTLSFNPHLPGLPDRIADLERYYRLRLQVDAFPGIDPTLRWACERIWGECRQAASTASTYQHFYVGRRYF